MSEGKKLDPLIYEHETEEEAASYDKWFRAKVQASIDDPRPSIPQDEAMAKVRDSIRAAAKRSANMTDDNKLDPIVSEFETKEDAADYDRWFRQQVQEAIDNPGKLTPHDEVMAEMDQVIAAAAARKRKAG
jgi:hypothetical protein